MSPTSLRPACPLLVDQCGEIDLGEFRGRDRWSGDEALSDAYELRPGDSSGESDRAVFDRHLDLGPGRQASAFPDRRGNDHAACLVDGSSHAISLPSDMASWASRSAPSL